MKSIETGMDDAFSLSSMPVLFHGCFANRLPTIGKFCIFVH